VRGLHASVAALARAELDVIVDHALLDPAWSAAICFLAMPIVYYGFKLVTALG
jgi:hypothetical protein